MSIPDPNHVLSPDTQAVLLLCGRFGRNGATPLNDSEYNQLAVWLQKQGMRPADLLDEDERRRLDAQGPPVAAARLRDLLERGAALAMTAALGSGGSAVGVLANDLARAATGGKYRGAIQDGRLVLVSPYDPGSGFNVGHAMRRNRYIYNLADYGLVASSSSGSGGTWQGAVEALRDSAPVFVWVRGQDVPKGNHQLMERGALPFPEGPWRKLGESLEQIHSARVGEPFQEKLLEENPSAAPLAESDMGHELPPPPETAYEAVLPVLLRHLRQPLNSKDLAQLLDVGATQAQAWLRKALEEKKVEKRTKPTRYVVADAGNDARDRRSA